MTVKLEPDHLHRLARPSQQVTAIAELIWNALDADASDVRVEFKRNELDAIEAITVIDNGTGIEASECTSMFGSLGGSWKARSGVTQVEQRPLHGRDGEGRFRAFALGSEVEWTTIANDTVRGRLQTRIRATVQRPDRFSIDEAQATEEPTGTRVHINGQRTSVESISSEKARRRLTREFALYLMRFPHVTLMYDSERIDPNSLIDRDNEVDLKSPDNRPVKLRVIEWKEELPRELVLCDEHGFSLDSQPPRIQAPDFWFTAYISWAGFDRQGVILAELDPVYESILSASRYWLRGYFRDRTRERTRKAVESWKLEGVYPFMGDPQNKVEATKRDLFDIVAVQAIPGLGVERKAKKLSLRLIRESLERSPSSLKTVLREVLDLPSQQLDELANLLDRTSLSALITASQVVSDRLDFLRSLELLLFDKKFKNEILERSQLHRMLAAEPWIFGEEYALAVDDQSIKEVLRRHVQNLGRNELNLEDIQFEDRTRGVVDLMLAKTVQDSTRQHNLIVELKRPNLTAGYSERQQIESYAMAVSNDARFHDTETKWDFVLLANDVSKDIRKLSHKRNQPPGLIHDDEELDLRVWIRRWGSLIEERRRALHFYREKLELDPARDQAIEYLKRKHAQFLPESLSETEERAS